MISPATRTNVMVFGASGFIGAHVAATLRRENAVTAIGRHIATNVDCSIDLVRANHADVVNLLRDAVPDVLINCVGATYGGVDELVSGNVVATARLLAAVVAEAPDCHFIHLSSSAEYGDTGERPVVETQETLPTSPYGITKLAGTRLVQNAMANGLRGTILRLFNLSGPGSPPSTLLGNVIQQLRLGAPAIRTGSLDAWRDYADVRDVANAIRLVVNRETPPVVHIGSGIATYLRDLVNRLIEISGQLVEVHESVPPSTHAGTPAATLRYQQASIGLARSALDWKPEISIDDSLVDSWHAAGIVGLATDGPGN